MKSLEGSGCTCTPRNKPRLHLPNNRSPSVRKLHSGLTCFQSPRLLSDFTWLSHPQRKCAGGASPCFTWLNRRRWVWTVRCPSTNCRCRPTSKRRPFSWPLFPFPCLSLQSRWCLRIYTIPMFPCPLSLLPLQSSHTFPRSQFRPRLYLKRWQLTIQLVHRQ